MVRNCITTAKTADNIRHHHIMKTTIITHNGFNFQIVLNEDGKFAVKQQNRMFPQGGAEYQRVGGGAIENGQIIKRNGCLAMDDDMDSAIIEAIKSL